MSSAEHQSLADQLRAAELTDAASRAARPIASSALINLSLDFTGNKPGDFFDQNSVVHCQEFLTLAARRDMPGNPLFLEATKPRQILTQEEIAYGSNQPPYTPPQSVQLRPNLGGQRSRPTSNREQRKAIERHYREHPPKQWETLWRGSGSMIGSAGDFNNRTGIQNPLYLCTDGKLRCGRSGSLFAGKSMAFGVGTVPSSATIAIGYETTETNDGYLIHKFNRLSLNDRLVQILRRDR